MVLVTIRLLPAISHHEHVIMMTHLLMIPRTRFLDDFTSEQTPKSRTVWYPSNPARTHLCGALVLIVLTALLALRDQLCARRKGGAISSGVLQG
jgi:hypothetical protein